MSELDWMSESIILHFRMRIGYGVYEKNSDPIRLQNFHIHTPLLSSYRCHGQLSKTCVPNLSCDYFNQSCSAKGKTDTAQKMYVVHRNTLSDSFRIRVVWFQPKQDSDQIRILLFRNRIASDSKNPLFNHLCSFSPCGDVIMPHIMLNS